MLKKNEELMITTRIALLEARKRENGNIIKKLQRRLRKIKNEAK